MGSAQRTALAVGVVLALCGSVAAADDAAGPITLPVAQSASVLPGDAEAADSDESAARYQTLSTLGALALGIIGLLWVRRHTTEL